MTQDDRVLVNHVKVLSPLFVIRTNILDKVDPPYADQIFNLYKEAKEYYFLYPSKTGSLVWKGTTKVVEGSLVVRHYVCYMEGFSRSNGSTKSLEAKRNRIIREIKCWCASTICIKRIYDLDR